MRDVLVLAIILGSVPICLVYPYFGVLMWSWVAYFNPHRFTFGFAYDFPVAQVIAIPTLIGAFFAREKNRGFMVRETVLVLMIWAWYIVTTLNASMVPELALQQKYANPQLINVSKMLLMTFLTILLVTNREKLRYLFLLTSFSFGVLAIKGAMFGLRTGGEHRVWGPPGSFVEDNNYLALATNMCLPMLYYMARTEQNKWLRLLSWFAFICGIGSVLLSYSRGGLLGLAVVLAMLSLKSKYKVFGITAIIIIGMLVISFAPVSWMDRMGNLAEGKIDNSAELRLHAWQFAFIFATHYPLTGGGFETFTPQLFAKYAPHLTFAGPHSLYFQQMGEHGFVGFGLFMTLLASTWFSLFKLRRVARRVPTLEWLIPYTTMLQTSQLAYMVSGAFLACGYFDLWYQIVASVVVMKVMCKRELERLQAAQNADIVVPTEEAFQFQPSTARA